MAGDDKPAAVAGDGTKPDANDGGSGRRSRRGRRGGGGQRLSASATPKVKFDGSCEGLKGHVYDILDYGQADAFARTTKELAGYAGRTMKEGDDVRLAIQKLAIQTFPKPAVPAAGADKFEELEYGAEVKIYLGRVVQLSSNMRTLYNIIIGQCSESMINKLESTDTFDAISSTSDSIGLLKAIKSMSFNQESQKFSPHALHDAMTLFYTCRQGERTTTEAYLETFNNTTAIVSYCGGALGTARALGNELAKERGIDIDTATPETVKGLRVEAQERYLAVAFILGADKKRFNQLLTEMENDYLKYQTPSAYPQTVTQAYRWLLRYHKERGYTPKHVGSNEIAFNHVESAGADGVLLANRNVSTITCHNCGKKGHYKSDCPELPCVSADQLLTDGLATGEFDSECSPTMALAGGVSESQ